MFIRWLLVSVSIGANGCASTQIDGQTDRVQTSFGPESNARMITTEEQFEEFVIGKPLVLMSEDIKATLKFESDNKAEGTIVRGSNASEDMSLAWEWVDSGYCRTGVVGDVTLDRRCESVELVEDVGIRLSYDDGSSPDEYWLFGSYHQKLVADGQSSCDLIADPVQAELCRQK